MSKKRKTKKQTIDKKPKIEKKSFLQRNKLISALILTFSVYFFYLLISEFNIISGNDDYCIFKLINYGDIAIGCVGFFYSWFISVIQPLFGNLNTYLIFQFIVTLLSIIAIDYVILSKLKSKTGLFLTIIFNIVYFAFAALEIRFSYTSTFACSAGFVLMVYGSQHEERKRFRITQIICGLLLLFSGTQVRFDPVLPMGAIAAVLAFGVLLTAFLKYKKENDAKTAFKSLFDKYIKTGILLVLAAIMVFGTNAASNALKYTVDGFVEQDEYNQAISKVVDYQTASYYEHTQFFNNLGIKSASDLTVLKKWFVDDEFYTTEKLHAISEFSKSTVNDGIARKGALSYVIYPIKNAFTKAVQNGDYVYYLIILAAVILAVILLWKFLPKQRAVVLKLAILALLWTFYIIVAGWFSINNMFALPLLVITLYIAVKFNNYQFIITAFMLSAMMVLYFYITTLRLWFHTGLAVIFPAFVMILFALDNENRVSMPEPEAVKAKLKKNKSKKSMAKPNLITILSVIISLLLIVSSVISSVVVYKNQVYVYKSQSNKQLGEYITNHPELTFVINQSCLYKHYYEPFILPTEKENMVNYGLWVTKSGYMQNTKTRNGITNIFRDSVNSSNIRIVLPENDQNIDSLKNYYNLHYVNPGQTTTFIKTDNAGTYAFYRVVTS